MTFEQYQSFAVAVGTIFLVCVAGAIFMFICVWVGVQLRNRSVRKSLPNCLLCGGTGKAHPGTLQQRMHARHP